MSNTSQTFNTISSDIQKSLQQLSKFRLELGVFTSKSKRKVQVGVTNAELMYIHENGSPLRNIPSRPVLDMTLRYANKNLLPTTIDKCIEICINTGGNESLIEQELNKLAIRIENYARKLIYSNDGRLAPNARSTIARKGVNHPLFDTGQLARSITCRVVKS